MLCCSCIQQSKLKVNKRGAHFRKFLCIASSHLSISSLRKFDLTYKDLFFPRVLRVLRQLPRARLLLHMNWFPVPPARQINFQNNRDLWWLYYSTYFAHPYSNVRHHLPPPQFMSMRTQKKAPSQSRYGGADSLSTGPPRGPGILRKPPMSRVATATNGRLPTETWPKRTRSTSRKRVSFADGSWPGWVEPKKERRVKGKAEVDVAPFHVSTLQSNVSSSVGTRWPSARVESTHHDRKDFAEAHSGMGARTPTVSVPFGRRRHHHHRHHANSCDTRRRRRDRRWRLDSYRCPSCRHCPRHDEHCWSCAHSEPLSESHTLIYRKQNFWVTFHIKFNQKREKKRISGLSIRFWAIWGNQNNLNFSKWI